MQWIFILLICLSFFFCASPQKKMEKAKNKDPQYQYNMGLFHLNSNQLDKAIQYLNKSLDLEPGFYLALNAMGLAYSMKGNLDKAAHYYKKCLESNPLFTEARNNLGSVYQEMGKLDKAEKEFKKVVSDKNYNGRELAYYNLARLYLVQNKTEVALEYIKKSIDLDKELAMAHNLKGIICERLDKLEEAIQSYNRASQLVPEELNFKFNLAVAYYKNKQFDEAKKIFKKLSSQTTDPKLKQKINQYLESMK
ncbi:tetratricopeptide repeat protein [bacterium]|nr:tetratricopeptide repeat protein [bacterium]